MPSEDQLLLGDNLEVLPRFADGAFQLIYIDPPFNTGGRRAADARDAAGDAGRRPRRLRRSALRTRAARRVLLPRQLRRLPRLPRAAPASRRTALLARRRHALLPHRLPRGALLQAAARRDLRARVLPQRDHLGLRLRRARRAGAGPPSTTRSSSTSRTPSATTSTARRSIASPTWRPGLVDAGEGRARQAADRRVVAHDRPDQRRGEDRLPDAEARGRRCGAWSQASTRPGDWCLDFFAGSGTLGAVAARLGRRYVLIDTNPEAVATARRRLGVGES